MKQDEERSIIADIFHSAFREDFAASEPSKGDYHPATDLEFLERLDNDLLSETERADFSRHVESCPFCRHEIAYFIRTGILFAEPETVPNRNPEPFSTVSTAAGRGRFPSGNIGRIVAAAALVLIAVGVGILFTSNRENPKFALQQTNTTELSPSVSSDQTPRSEFGESPVSEPIPGPAKDSTSSPRSKPTRRVRGTLGPETDTTSEDLEKAEQGDLDAQCSLGVRYRYGIDGTAQDPAKAVEWFRKAADQEHAEAQYELGKCYAEGVGVDQDPAEAVAWFRKAAEQGDAEAECELGRRYAEGADVDPDPAEAVAWFRKAANRGYAEAQYELGKCYAEGVGVDQDPAEAVAWYREAADRGDMMAQFALGLCYAEGFGVEKDNDEAVYLLQDSIDQGFADAEMFQKAAEEGHDIDPEILSELDLEE